MRTCAVQTKAIETNSLISAPLIAKTATSDMSLASSPSIQSHGFRARVVLLKRLSTIGARCYFQQFLYRIRHMARLCCKVVLTSFLSERRSSYIWK